MVTTTLIRPSVLLPALCAPSVSAPAVPVVAEAWAPVSRVHQVQIQAELALATGSTNGITGFMGLGVSVDSKRYDDARGIPPRGRPV
jgi:hypothetical protein